MGVVVSKGKNTQMLSPENVYTKIYIKETKEIAFGDCKCAYKNN